MLEGFIRALIPELNHLLTTKTGELRIRVHTTIINGRETQELSLARMDRTEITKMAI